MIFPLIEHEILLMDRERARDATNESKERERERKGEKEKKGEKERKLRRLIIFRWLMRARLRNQERVRLAVSLIDA